MRVLYLWVVVILVLSGGNVVAGGKHEGGHPGDGHHWQAPAEMAARENPVARTPGSVARGMELYGKYCASCHGQEAQGDGPVAAALKVKPTNLAAMAGIHPDGDFAWKISRGRPPMPGWEKRLSAKQIWDLVNYIQSLQGEQKAEH